MITEPFLLIAMLFAAKATIIFQDKYERPNKAFAHTEKRVDFAKEIFNKLVNP